MTRLNQRIIRRLHKIYNFIKYENNYVEFDIQKEQELNFKSIKLNRSKGLNLLSFLLKKNPFLDSDMNSEHSIIFCSLSLSTYKLKNILEIGTYDAKNAFLLSEIFPKSRIDTYDLKDNNDNFRSSYGRDDDNKLRNFINDRNRLLKKKNNISFYQADSLNLSINKKKYDLIWIDGAHCFPHVAIDIANSIRLINKNGIIMCDDVIIDAAKYDQYNSKDCLKTLNAFKQAKIINFKLLYKRISKKYNSVPNQRKFIAFCKKI